MRAPSTSSRSRCARTGILAILALVVGLVAEGVHVLVEPHTWCEVHEAMEHGEEAALADDGHAADGLHLEAEDAESGHETCRLASLRRVEPALAIEPPAVRGPASSTAPLRALLERRAPPRIPLYRIAPKNSPPLG